MARVRARSLLPELSEFQQHEERHRNLFADYLHSHGIRRCFSYHLCGMGGFGLGLVTGLMGRHAIFATTYAVENVVLEHLRHQMEYLEHLDEAAYTCVNEIVLDEQEHHDTAHDHLDTNSHLSKALIAIVKTCTECVIRFGMR